MWREKRPLTRSNSWERGRLWGSVAWMKILGMKPRQPAERASWASMARAAAERRRLFDEESEAGT
jgi:hypothetical protein